MTFTVGFAKNAARLLAALVIHGLSATAFAGEFYDSGGAAIKGFDPVAYFKENKPVRGSETYTARHKGSLFRFASAANRDAFAAEPDRYAPQYGGFCAYAVAKGYKAKIEPDAFTVVDGKLYLNYDLRIQAEWRKDIPGYVRQAEKNWPEMSKKPNP